MKIQPQHYAELKSAIAKLDQARVANGHPGYAATAAEYREKGFTPRRFRFDWQYAAISSHWVAGVIYPTGCNDDHIDTALRAIARELTADPQHWSARK